jgi:pyrimidine-nucleoside phosphorylase
MVDNGKNAGKKMLALITDMDIPLGNAIGNSLEVIEAVNTLKGNGPKDFTVVCIALASSMLHLAGHGSEEECKQKVQTALSDGTALATFKKMVKAQGGKAEWLDDTSLFPKATICREVLAQKDGYITKIDTEGYGISALILGAGRNTKEDKIDYSAGIILNKKTGDKVEKGEVLATLYTNDETKLSSAQEKFIASTIISNEKPVLRPLILDKVY